MNRVWATLGSVAFLLLAPGSVAVLVPWWISRWQVGAPFFGFAALRVGGIALIVIGLAVLLDAFARFALQGVGTPAPVLPTRHLVVSGLYRYVRNPMYLAVESLIFGQALFFGSVALLIYGLLVWLIFHSFVVFYEEPTLRKTFGSEYDAFCATVPRWIPRIRRRSVE